MPTEKFTQSFLQTNLDIPVIQIDRCFDVDNSDCVTEDKDGVKQVIPTKLLYHTIKAVQELNDKIDGTNTVQGRIDPYTKEEKQAFVDALKQKEKEDMERRMKANGNK